MALEHTATSAPVNFLDPRLPSRFWDKVTPEPNSGCWLWTGAVSPTGYGHFRQGPAIRNTHRHAYVSLVGAVPDGLELDHQCSTRSCCNPAHLSPVTSRENTRRGKRHRDLPSHCKNGHKFSLENTFNDRGARGCRKCCHAIRLKRKAAA